MALDYSILGRKNEHYFDSGFDETRKVRAIDLLSKSMTGIDMVDFEGVLVTKEYVARPDLISLAIYGSDKYADIICKVNGISNPFELNEKMVLLCPRIDEAIAAQNLAIEKNSFVNNPKEDSILNINNNNKKQVNEKRSPIESTILDNNYIIFDDIKGLVFY